MRFELGIDTRTLPLEVAEENLIKVLLPNPIAVTDSEDSIVRKALAAPIGSRPLKEIVQPGEKLIIVTSDVTRPLPSYKILPALLEELAQAGIPDEDMEIVFALGCHRRHTEAEMRRLVGDEVFERLRCYDSDTDFLPLGVTKNGTPVDVTRRVAEADRRLCLANIEYHYFAGYSGGAKAIMPGVSTRAAIEANHRHMVEALATAGQMDPNPVRDDLEEAIRFCPIDFILNVVLDEKKNIVHAVAGDYIEAHRAGCRWLDDLYSIPIPEKADVVVVSQGGYPKDLNVYQTQKALDNAKHAVKDGGIIIVVGSCKEGYGEETFAQWMEEASSPDDLIRRIQEKFVLGGHKAAAIALVQKKASVFLVSDLEDAVVRNMFMEPFATAEAAYKEARRRLGEEARVLIMPYGGSTLPRLVAE